MEKAIAAVIKRAVQKYSRRRPEVIVMATDVTGAQKSRFHGANSYRKPEFTGKEPQVFQRRIERQEERRKPISFVARTDVLGFTDSESETEVESEVVVDTVEPLEKLEEKILSGVNSVALEPTRTEPEVPNEKAAIKRTRKVKKVKEESSEEVKEEGKEESTLVEPSALTLTEAVEEKKKTRRRSTSRKTKAAVEEVPAVFDGVELTSGEQIVPEKKTEQKRRTKKSAEKTSGVLAEAVLEASEGISEVSEVAVKKTRRRRKPKTEDENAPGEESGNEKIQS